MRVWVVLVEQYKMVEHPSLCVRFKNRPLWTVIINTWILPGDWTVVGSRLQGLCGTNIMHVSLLHLNRLLEGDIPFNTELRVRLVDGEDLAQVEFRNTLTHTDRTRLLCKFHLTLPSCKMPRAVSITYYFKLEHFDCSNLLPVMSVI